MRIFKHIFDFYLNSSIHVALAVYAFTFITLKQLNISHDRNILSFVFFGSITGYNFVKYFGLAKLHHRSLANWMRVIQIFSMLSIVLMCYFALQLETKTLIIVVIMAVITFFYATPLLPKEYFLENTYNLRSISGLKVYVIAFVWSVVTVVLPVVNNDHPISFDVFIMSIQRYLFVIVLILPFDIRDLLYDSLKLSTIPQKIGIKKTKYLGFSLLIINFLLEFFKDDLNLEHLLVLFVITVITFMIILFSGKDRGRNYSAFWVEGLPIFWLILILMFD